MKTEKEYFAPASLSALIGEPSEGTMPNMPSLLLATLRNGEVGRSRRI
jgi:hypothetical protein